jgi:hypothetical protein
VAADASETPHGAAPNEAAVRASVPITTDRNLILVPISVGGSVAGSAPFNVVLDTGMPMRGVILYRSPRVDALPLEFAEAHGISGAGGDGAAVPTRIATGAHVEIGGVALSDVPIISLTAPPGFGSTQEGIIGAELFDKFAVEVDVDAHRLRLLDSGAFEPRKESSVIPLHLRRGSAPFVDARVAVGAGDPVPVEIAIDLGSSHALWLNRGKENGIVQPEAGIDTILGRGLSGDIVGHVARARRFELGDFAFDDVIALFPSASHQDPGGVHFQDGILGGETLRRFRITFDYPKERMIVERGARFGDPFEFDMSGLVAEPSSPDRRTVRSVLAGSPAAQADIQVGDVILAIDGKAVRELGSDGIMRALRVDQAEVQLTIERGSTKLEKKLRLRRLV